MISCAIWQYKFKETLKVKVKGVNVGSFTHTASATVVYVADRGALQRKLPRPCETRSPRLGCTGTRIGRMLVFIGSTKSSGRIRAR
jgi:hypothetical protein